MPRLQPALLAMLLFTGLVANACGEDGAGTPDAAADMTSDTETDGQGDVGPDGQDVVEEPAETEPPEFRDVRVTIGGALGSEVDLGARDSERVLPVAAEATFRVFVSDNQSAAADLVVEVVDRRLGDPPEAVPDQTAVHRNGLWFIDLTVGPGMELAVRARDEAGNEALSEHVLIVPAQQEAIAGRWERRIYDTSQVISDRLDAEWSGGVWCIELEEGFAGGSYDFTTRGGNLRLDYRHDQDCSIAVETSEWESVELEEIGPFHVDDQYLSTGYFGRQGTGAGVVDAWERSWSVAAGGQDGLGPFDEVTLTLELGEDDTWTETRVTADPDGGETTETRSGTYATVTNEDYTDNVGDFLDRLVTHIDGEPLDESQRLFDLWVIRADRLLINPFITVEE